MFKPCRSRPLALDGHPTPVPPPSALGKQSVLCPLHFAYKKKNDQAPNSPSLWSDPWFPCQPPFSPLQELYNPGRYTLSGSHPSVCPSLSGSPCPEMPLIGLVTWPLKTLSSEHLSSKKLSYSLDSNTSLHAPKLFIPGAALLLHDRDHFKCQSSPQGTWIPSATVCTLLSWPIICVMMETQ